MVPTQTPNIRDGFADYPMVGATFRGEQATTRESGVRVELHQKADSR